MKDRIIIFTLSGCFHCTFLKEELNNLSIPFTEIEVTANPKIWEQVVNQTGHDSLPTIFIQKDGTESGPVYVPGRDYDTHDEIIEIIKTYI
jgi:glutaredoxin